MSIAFGPGWVTYVFFEMADDGDDKISSFSLVFDGSNAIEPVGIEPITTVISSIQRDDDGIRVIDIDGYHKLFYRDLWRNIDLIFYFGQGGTLKYDIILKVGADPLCIGFRYLGIDQLEIDKASGDLIVRSDSVTIRDRSPIAFQNLQNSMKDVECEFKKIDDCVVGFRLGEYAIGFPVVIDPQMVYSTYLGYNEGSSSWRDACADEKGCVYFAGRQFRPTFNVTPGAFDTTHNGEEDIFVMKLDTRTSDLVYSTYIGGSDRDMATAIQVDDQGHVYLCGNTPSADFPATNGSYQSTLPGLVSAFVLKLSPDGSALNYSTFIGGSDVDKCYDLWLCDNGSVYITGNARSSDFPLTPDAYDSTRLGGDLFILRLGPEGKHVTYSTFFSSDQATGKPEHIWVDDNDCVYVAGRVGKHDFPTTVNAFDRTANGNTDVFVFALNIANGTLNYSTYIGGREIDAAVGLWVDGEGCVYLCGFTASNGFPTTTGSFDETFGGSFDGFLLKMDQNGSSLLYSTFLGDDAHEKITDLVVDAEGYAYVVGYTADRDFPTTSNAYCQTQIGQYDGIISVMNPSGSDLDYSTFFGSEEYDYILWIHMNETGHVFVSGTTESTTFPTTDDAYLGTTNVTADAFLAIMFIDPKAPRFMVDDTPDFGTTGDIFEFNISILDNIELASTSVEYWFGSYQDYHNTSLNMINGTLKAGTWSHIIRIPEFSLDPLWYIVHAEDSFGNTNRTGLRRVPIIDNDRPEMQATIGEPTTGDLLLLELEVFDNIDVAEAWAFYWFDDGIMSGINVSMDGIEILMNGNGSYAIGVLLPLDGLPEVNLVFSSVDGSGNWNHTDVQTIRVRDNDPPSIISDLSDDSASTGDAFKLSVSISDNIETFETWAMYWYGPDISSASNVSLRRIDGMKPEDPDTFTATIIIPLHSTASLSYQFGTVDGAGNTNVTMMRTIPVIDLRLPEIQEDLSDDVASTGDEFSFEIVVNDNIGIRGVSIEYWYVDEPGTVTRIGLEPLDASGLGNGTYTMNPILMPNDSLSSLTYIIIATDLAMNQNRSEDVVVQLTDNDPPVVVDLSSGEALKGLDYPIILDAMDNIGLVGLTIEWWFGEGTHSNVSILADHMGNIPVPRQTDEPLFYFITAVDGSDNWIITPTRSVVPSNSPPLIHGFNTWTVMEEKVEEVDLTDFIQDLNDDHGALTLTCEYANVTIEGLLVSIREDRWLPDFVLELTLTDGEDVTIHAVTLEIINVNDAPQIVDVQPPSNTTFSYGEDITFIIETYDEDEDQLTISIMNKGNVLGTGNEQTLAQLPSGSNTLTVIVYDGKMTTQQDIILIIQDEDEQMIFSTIFLIIIITIIAIAITVYILKMKNDER